MAGRRLFKILKIPSPAKSRVGGLNTRSWQLTCYIPTLATTPWWSWRHLCARIQPHWEMHWMRPQLRMPGRMHISLVNQAATEFARTLRISRRRHVQLPNLGIQPNNRRVNSKYSETTNIKFGPFPCHKTRFFFPATSGFSLVPFLWSSFGTKKQSTAVVWNCAMD